MRWSTPSSRYAHFVSRLAFAGGIGFSRAAIVKVKVGGPKSLEVGTDLGDHLSTQKVVFSPRNDIGRAPSGQT